MSVEMVPLVAWDTENARFVPLGLHLLPEYYAREAARFAGYRWGEWVEEQAITRIGVVAHYLANKLFAAHESDALALKQEQESRAEAAKRGH